MRSLAEIIVTSGPMTPEKEHLLSIANAIESMEMKTEVRMTITKDEYAKVCDYIRSVAGGTHLNVDRVKVCQWIVEQVSEGAIRVEPE